DPRWRLLALVDRLCFDRHKIDYSKMQQSGLDANDPYTEPLVDGHGNGRCLLLRTGRSRNRDGVGSWCCAWIALAPSTTTTSSATTAAGNHAAGQSRTKRHNPEQSSPSPSP